MKLFSDSKKKNEPDIAQKPKKGAGAQAQSIVVISPNETLLSNITNLLSINNFNNVVARSVNFFALQDDSVLRNATTVIIDIGDVTDITKICDTVTLLVPANARQVFLGNNDSIVFAQGLMSAGIDYLHAKSQLSQLISHLQQTETTLMPRNIMKISVLGCKGGVGTTTVAWQIFQSIGMQASIPSLLVQGASGSRDLDLMISRPLPRDGSISEVGNNQSVLIEMKNDIWTYNDSRFNNFNLVLFDHDVHAQSYEDLEVVFNESNTLILVINRDLSALRLAKYLLDEKQRIDLSRNGKNQRVFICLNENHPVQKDELYNDDVEQYLSTPLSVINPWNTKKVQSLSGTPLWRFAEQSLLGKMEQGVEKQKFLSSLLTLRPGRKS